MELNPEIAYYVVHFHSHLMTDTEVKAQRQGLAGRITLGRECQEVEWQVENMLKEHEKKIILDFSELKYLDSTGVGILVMLWQGEASRR